MLRPQLLSQFVYVASHEWQSKNGGSITPPLVSCGKNYGLSITDDELVVGWCFSLPSFVWLKVL